VKAEADSDSRRAPPPAVQAVLDRWPPEVRVALLGLRDLVLDTADRIEGVGPVTETLKWGEPAYRTEHTGAGTTIRLGWKDRMPTRYALYFDCRTTLVDTFRSRYPELAWVGDRALLLELGASVPEGPVADCIGLALTYHARKGRRRSPARRRP
jgi:hypothetical protein